MAINNPALLDIYAIMAQQAYQDEPPFDDGPTAYVAAPNGPHVEIAQLIDGPVGFCAPVSAFTMRHELFSYFAQTDHFEQSAMLKISTSGGLAMPQENVESWRTSKLERLAA